jgi:hypothetical protein
MKKIIAAMVGYLVLGTLLLSRADAVVPYPVSVDGEDSFSQQGVAGSTSPRSTSEVADKLAEDQRRLESVLQDLKEDQKALEQTNSKENHDGHTLR